MTGTYIICLELYARMVGLAPNWVRLAQMGQIRGFFRSDFSAFSAGANQTHFGAKPTIPAM